MSQTVSIASIAPAPAAASEESVEQISAAAFESRWRAWQARGREHDRLLRRRVFMIAPAIVIAGAIAYSLVTR